MRESESFSRLKKTAVSGIVLQFATLLSGFIVPWLIIHTFGSEINGIINSITKFLGLITFLELGLGAVVPSALYKPLAERDTKCISEIIVSAQSFFNLLGIVLCFYVMVLVAVFPHIKATRYDWVYTGILIVAISINLFARYFFGMVNSLLIKADQKGYIVNCIQTIALILNTCICFCLIKLNYSIQVIQFAGSFAFLICPCYLWFYVRGCYSLDRKIKYHEEPIKQKWNGVAQHIAAVLIDSTPIIILSFMTNFGTVSVFSIYSMVVSGVKGLLLSVTGGITPLLGNFFAKNDFERLNAVHSWIEWLIHTTTTLIFTIAAFTIVPFVLVFTKGITDINYDVLIFAILFCFASSLHGYRLPYILMILAANKYKETQNCYIVAAFLTVFFSFIGVLLFGLTGVSIGLIVSIGYQIIWMFEYNRKYLVKLSRQNFFFLVLADLLVISMTGYFSTFFDNSASNYFEWIIFASKISIVAFGFSFLANIIFFGRKVAICLSITLNKISEKIK